MNDNKSLKATMIEVLSYLKGNIKAIFMVGIFVGLICVSYTIIKAQIASNEYILYYKVTMTAEYKCEEGKTFTKNECKKVLFSDEVKKAMIEYLGGEKAYADYEDIIYYKVGSSSLTLTYEGRDRNETVELLRTVYRNLSEKLCLDGYVSYINAEPVPSIVNERKKAQTNTGIGITYAAEFGMLAGIILAIAVLSITYLTRGNVRDEFDIYKNFNLPLLANIPYVDESGEKDEKA